MGGCYGHLIRPWSCTLYVTEQRAGKLSIINRIVSIVVSYYNGDIPSYHSKMDFLEGLKSFWTWDLSEKSH